jgi:hypothetical protein
MVHMHRAVFVLAMLIWAACAGPCWAQRGIPFRPPVRLPGPRVIPIPVHHVPGYNDTRDQSNTANNTDNWIVPVGIVAALGTVVALIVSIVLWNGRTVAHLRIIATPTGEAPERIRRAWVGVALPLRHWETEPSDHLSVGVLSHLAPARIMGYAVDGRAAVNALASHSPEAATWWRNHAPHVLERGYQFFFPCEACEYLGSAVRGDQNWHVPEPASAGKWPVETNSSSPRTSVLGLGVDGASGVWLRERAAWED